MQISKSPNEDDDGKLNDMYWAVNSRYSIQRHRFTTFHMDTCDARCESCVIFYLFVLMNQAKQQKETGKYVRHSLSLSRLSIKVLIQLRVTVCFRCCRYSTSAFNVITVILNMDIVYLRTCGSY